MAVLLVPQSCYRHVHSIMIASARIEVLNGVWLCRLILSLLVKSVSNVIKSGLRGWGHKDHILQTDHKQRHWGCSSCCLLPRSLRFPKVKLISKKKDS